MHNDNRKTSAMVVDDDPCITQIVEAYLFHDFREQLETVAFNDACRASDWLGRHHCDLILSDIEMPGCDGLEMLRVAKQRNPWTSVVFMTAHSTWDRIAEAVVSGASDYLLKPVTRQELYLVVKNECARLNRWRTAVLGTLHHALERF